MGEIFSVLFCEELLTFEKMFVKVKFDMCGVIVIFLE